MRVLSAVVGAAALASAAASTPPTALAAAPAPCGGTPQITDPSGDGHHPNTDVLEAWFSEPAAGRLQATIKVHTASGPPPPDDSDAASLAFTWEVAGTRRYVRIEGPRAGPPRFDTGTWTASGGFESEGATSGEVTTGTGGTATIEIPSPPAAGTVLARPMVLTWDGGGSPDHHWVDRAPGATTPDGVEYGADFVAGSCSAAPVPSPAPGAPAPTPTTAVALSAPGRLTGGGTAKVTGRVTPARAGVAVEVVASARRTRTTRVTTGADGRFSAGVPITETTRLTARADGLSSQTLTVTVRSTVRITIRRLLDGRTQIDGSVRPAALTGRVLLLRTTSPTPVARTRARNGRFRLRLRSARPGRYQAVFIPAGDRAERSTSNTGTIR